MTKLWLLGLLVAALTFVAVPRDANAAACANGFWSSLVSPCTVNGGATTFTASSAISMPVGLFVQFLDSAGSFSISFSTFTPTVIPPFGLVLSPGYFTTANSGGDVHYTLSGGLSSTFINRVQLDSQRADGTTVVEKAIAAAGMNLFSNNGSTDVGAFSNLELLTVIDRLTITGDGHLSSFTNQFFSVPEPASMMVFASGVVLFGLARRRRQA